MSVNNEIHYRPYKEDKSLVKTMTNKTKNDLQRLAYLVEFLAVFVPLDGVKFVVKFQVNIAKESGRLAHGHYARHFHMFQSNRLGHC